MRRYTEAPLEVRKANNGYIVSTRYTPEYMTAPMMPPKSYLERIFTLKNVYKIFSILQKVKNKEEVTEEDFRPEPDDEEQPVYAGPGPHHMPEPENNLHIFATWSEASAFIEQELSK